MGKSSRTVGCSIRSFFAMKDTLPRSLIATSWLSIANSALVTSVRATAPGDLFSAPLVAGLVALLQAGEPGLTPAQVEARLAATAVDLGAAGWDPSFGHGRVDAAAALAAPAACGLGAELAFLLPLLMALRSRPTNAPRSPRC